MQLTRTHRILIGVVVAGAVVIAGIGFAGSYAAVRELALEKGFGNFSYVFPVGIDAGICVLLALDLLLTWMRIPFPLLRQTAWLLTAATIAFNGAASWPDPLGVGMHAVIPILFVVSVEAARHAVGRIADITADKHMEGVRLTRWLLSPLPTFKLWRRMKLWELRSYEQVIKLEQDRLIYRARLQARYGRSWKRKAPVEALMPLRLAKIGVPLAETAAVGLAAAGIEPALLPPAPAADSPSPSAPALPAAPQETSGASEAHEAYEAGAARIPGPRASLVKQPEEAAEAEEAEEAEVRTGSEGEAAAPGHGHDQVAEQAQQHPSPWFAAGPVGQQPQPEAGYEPGYQDVQQAGYEPGHQDVQQAVHQDSHQDAHQDAPQVMVPSGPGRSRPLGGYDPDFDPEFGPDFASADADFVLDDEAYYNAFRRYTTENAAFPTPLQLGSYVADLYGQQLPEDELEMYAKRYEERFQQELDEHIA